MPCIVVSSFSHYRYCLCACRPTVHSLVIRAAVIPKPLTQVRVMRFRRVATPLALMTATKAIARSDYGLNPNGAKLYTAAIRRCRFKRPRSEG